MTAGQVDKCTGACCVAFTLPITYEQLAARASGENPDPEMVFIHDMVTPITNGTVRRRRKQHGGTTEPVVKRDEGYHFKCRHWDPTTRLCTVYDERPKMCRDYPYEKTCSMGCGGCSKPEVQEEWKARREAQKGTAEDVVP